MLYQVAIEERTGLEMIKMLASGECSAQALAKSRTIEALVLNKSAGVRRVGSTNDFYAHHHGSCRACGEHQRG